jgi:hypothetical protein
MTNTKQNSELERLEQEMRRGVIVLAVMSRLMQGTVRLLAYQRLE